MKDKGRWLFAVAMVLSPVAAAAVFVATSSGMFVALKKPAPRSSAVLGWQGEWVTRPDGRRVCRLSADLMIDHRIDPSFCADWQEPEPKVGQPVDGWVRANQGGYQIMIEGRWRP